MPCFRVKNNCFLFYFNIKLHECFLCLIKSVILKPEKRDRAVSTRHPLSLQMKQRSQSTSATIWIESVRARRTTKRSCRKCIPDRIYGLVKKSLKSHNLSDFIKDFFTAPLPSVPLLVRQKLPGHDFPDPQGHETGKYERSQNQPHSRCNVEARRNNKGTFHNSDTAHKYRQQRIDGKAA